MNHSILFVDDEGLVLQGLQRSLRSMRHEWDVDFCDSGQKALAAMALKNYDILVSDMRMPEMDGAQLLNETMRLYPSTIRFVLSGQADQQLIMRSIGAAHQYLSKPCESEILIASLRRGLELKRLLGNETLRHLVARMASLPSKPALYVEILHRLREQSASIEEISQVIIRDPAMAAKILKVVNSAFFGLPLKIASVTEAISYLGLDIIRSLVLSLHVFEQFEEIPSDMLELDALWAHSFQVANAARRIVELEGGEKKMIDEAFTAGLLHDAGKLIIAANFKESYKACLDAAHHGRIPLEVEEKEFGCSHAEVGAYLFGLWGLPLTVVEAVAYHHRPAGGTSVGFSLLTAVHAANALVHQKYNLTSLPAIEILDEAYLSQLDLGSHVPAWREAI